MNNADLTRIEEVTGLSLPTAYENLLRNFPAELCALLEFHQPEDRELFTDVDTIVHWNRVFREPTYEYENSSGEMRKLPSNHIVIGANPNGDFYHLDVAQSPSPVIFWNHEDGEMSKCAKHLDMFVREIFTTTADAILYCLNLR